MVAPRSSTTESPRAVGHIAAIAGRSIPGNMRRQNRAIAVSAPVLPAETATSASPFLTASMASHIEDDLAAAAQRLARLVVHADGDVGMDDARGRLHRRMFVELRLDQRAIAEQQEFGVGMPCSAKSRRRE